MYRRHLWFPTNPYFAKCTHWSYCVLAIPISIQFTYVRWFNVCVLTYWGKTFGFAVNLDFLDFPLSLAMHSVCLGPNVFLHFLRILHNYIIISNNYCWTLKLQTINTHSARDSRNQTPLAIGVVWIVVRVIQRRNLSAVARDVDGSRIAGTG